MRKSTQQHPAAAPSSAADFVHGRKPAPQALAERKTAELPAHRQILDTARELFAARGFENATIRMISQKAGVNLAAVNYYFRTKGRLYEAVYRDAFASIDIDLGGIVESVRDNETWRAAIDSWVGRILYLFITDEPQIATLRKLVVRERSQPTPYCAELLDLFMLPVISVLRRLVEMAMPNNSAHERQAAFVSFLSQCTCFLDHDEPWDKILFSRTMPTSEWIEVMRVQITNNIFARLSYPE
jgi:Transcriptional regulator